MDERPEYEKNMLEVWARHGYVTLTEGNVVDYDVVHDHVKGCMDLYKLVQIAFDPYNATQLSTQLGTLGGDEFMVKFRQGFLSMGPAMKDLDRALGDGLLEHAGNPVLRWMADNLVVRMDPAENVKPDKASATGRIDGIVALAMALYRAMLAVKGKKGSVYSRRAKAKSKVGLRRI